MSQKVYVSNIEYAFKIFGTIASLILFYISIFSLSLMYLEMKKSKPNQNFINRMLEIGIPLLGGSLIVFFACQWKFIVSTQTKRILFAIYIIAKLNTVLNLFSSTYH